MGDRIEGAAGDNLGQGQFGKGNQAQNVTLNVTDPRYDMPADDRVTFPDLVRAIIGDRRFNEPGLLQRVAAIERQQAETNQRIGRVEAELKAELIELKDLVKMRNANKERVPYTHWQGIALAVLIAVVASMLTVLLWNISAGGTLDGQLGAALFALFYG